VTVPGLPGLRRIAVVRALSGLGDFLCAVPALRALRRGCPGAHVTLIGLPVVRPLVERFGGYVDELMEFPGFPGIPEAPVDPGRTVRFLAAAQAREFDLAVQMHGSGQATNQFAALLGARRTAGFALGGGPRPDRALFIPYPADQPEPLRHLRLMRSLGMPADDAGLEFPLLGRDEEEFERVAQYAELRPGGYACVQVGAAEARRRWPPERFAAVADGLAERGLAPVLTGTPHERELTAATAAAMSSPAVDLAGETSLGGLAAVLAAAAVTVTNDTGTSHLAAALGAPSVVIFSASDPRRWAPLATTRHRSLGDASGGGAEPPSCLGEGCRRFGDPVLSDVTPAMVLAECDALLGEARIRTSAGA
jgi:ADP-heptose:LPS heptosyltransferase